jgi:hypothetical protein
MFICHSLILFVTHQRSPKQTLPSTRSLQLSTVSGDSILSYSDILIGMSPTILALGIKSYIQFVSFYVRLNPRSSEQASQLKFIGNTLLAILLHL